MNLLGFWSYVHADDQVDMGRIVALAHDIVANYEALTTEQIDLFLDRDDLHWGDEWRDKVDDSLSNVAFFIPVITPRYFTRPECRRELQFFESRTRELGIRALILPILYIDVPSLHDESPDDPLVALIKDIHWTPWLLYRFLDRRDGSYRAAVASLAEELVRRVAEVEAVDVVAAAEQSSPEPSPDEEPPGMLDRFAELEAAMPRWAETLQAIGQEIERIGSVLNAGAADMQRGDAQGKGFAARLIVARRVANELSAPVESIERLGREYASDLASIDVGIHTLLVGAAAEVTDPENEAEADSYCEFVHTLRVLASSSSEGLASVENLVKASEPLDQASKDMRPILRRMRSSLTALLEAREVTQSWVNLAESLGVECDGTS